MTLVTVKALENLINGLTDRSAPRGTIFKMEAGLAKENSELGYVQIIEGNPDLQENPRREVGTFTVGNIKPAEPEKILSPLKGEAFDSQVKTLKESLKGMEGTKLGDLMIGNEEEVVNSINIASSAISDEKLKEFEDNITEVRRGRKPKID